MRRNLEVHAKQNLTKQRSSIIEACDYSPRALLRFTIVNSFRPLRVLRLDPRLALKIRRDLHLPIRGKTNYHPNDNIEAKEPETVCDVVDYEENDLM